MDSYRYEELTQLAESVAEENFSEGRTNLISIIDKNPIIIIRGNYECYFVGILRYEADRFYLYLNMDQLHEDNNPRIRFTIAHELGHYFIDEHRNLLKQGVSLSFNKQQNNYFIEKEANHFASFLLMPRQRFITRAFDFENGLIAILGLAKEFETSIECTSIQYIILNCCTGIIIRWNEDFSVKFVLASDSLSKITGIASKPTVKINSKYILDIFQGANPITNEIFERATKLSRWVASVPPNSKNDLIGLEQTFKMGNYGGITLINFVN
ncbi:MAG: ImmA/IrrE family metallo-endopeptidase [Mucilaginibacter sp.]|nr:ImmA/IrrE family metallo-endopeptidase [Mucilaginibacter sp.]